MLPKGVRMRIEERIIAFTNQRDARKNAFHSGFAIPNLYLMPMVRVVMIDLLQRCDVPLGF